MWGHWTSGIPSVYNRHCDYYDLKLDTPWVKWEHREAAGLYPWWGRTRFWTIKDQWHSHRFSVCLPLSRSLSSDHPSTSLSVSLSFTLPICLSVCTSSSVSVFLNFSISHLVSHSVFLYVSSYLFFCVPLSRSVFTFSSPQETQGFWCHNLLALQKIRKHSTDPAQIEPLPALDPPPKKKFPRQYWRVKSEMRKWI